MHAIIDAVGWLRPEAESTSSTASIAPGDGEPGTRAVEYLLRQGFRRFDLLWPAGRQDVPAFSSTGGGEEPLLTVHLAAGRTEAFGIISRILSAAEGPVLLARAGVLYDLPLANTRPRHPMAPPVVFCETGESGEVRWTGWAWLRSREGYLIERSRYGAEALEAALLSGPPAPRIVIAPRAAQPQGAAGGEGAQRRTDSAPSLVVQGNAMRKGAGSLHYHYRRAATRRRKTSSGSAWWKGYPDEYSWSFYR